MNKSDNKNEKKCKLCNKPYTYNYELFGRTCLKNLYKNFKIAIPKVLNKENYFCTRIAWRCHKFFLNKDKKYALVQNYIALCYLKKINNENFISLAQIIQSNIDEITAFNKKYRILFGDFTLNDFYRVYNSYKDYEELNIKLDRSNINEEIKKNDYYEMQEDYKKYQEAIKKIKENQKNINVKIYDLYDESFLDACEVIFDTTKMKSPIFHLAFYNLQREFWKIVVAGGILFDMKLSAYLLIKSIDLPEEKENEEQIIDDEYVNKILFSNKEFTNKINSYLNGEDVNIEDSNVTFNDKDLFFSLHNVTLKIKGIKNKLGIWSLEIELKDKYDFTDIIWFNGYANKDFTENIPKALVSSTLNNFASISSAYDVLKNYKFTIKTKVNSYRM